MHVHKIPQISLSGSNKYALIPENSCWRTGTFHPPVRCLWCPNIGRGGGRRQGADGISSLSYWQKPLTNRFSIPYPSRENDILPINYKGLAHNVYLIHHLPLSQLKGVVAVTRIKRKLDPLEIILEYISLKPAYTTNRCNLFPIEARRCRRLRKFALLYPFIQNDACREDRQGWL